LSIVDARIHRFPQPLKLFLRKAAAPLGDNITETALKRAVLHRKNALFYRTLNGAQVGDLFMSLIHTCQLCGAKIQQGFLAIARYVRCSRCQNWVSSVPQGFVRLRQTGAGMPHASRLPHMAFTHVS
jgi:hypothetical protein